MRVELKVRMAKAVHKKAADFINQNVSNADEYSVRRLRRIVRDGLVDGKNVLLFATLKDLTLWQTLFGAFKKVQFDEEHIVISG